MRSSLLIVLGAALVAQRVQGARAPNIIWLQTDSMDGRLLDPTSPYYDKVKLRGIKGGLVAKGATFARHFTASPQCVPSRTSMLTGRYAHEMDTTNNGQGLARSTKTGVLDSNCVAAWNATTCAAFAAVQNQSFTLLDLLAGAGYDLQLFARFDVGAGVMDDYPAHGPTGDGFHGGPVLDILARGANIPGATKEEPLNATRQDVADPYAADVAAGEKVVNFLMNHDPLSEAPFLLWMGLLAPHPPYSSNASYLEHVNMTAADAPLPVCQPDRASMHPYDAQMSILKNCYQRDYSAPELLEMRTTYWGAVGEAMEIVERVLAAAEASGHLNNTVVVYTSDHGEMTMEHRMDYKNNLREPSLRVPLIIAPFNVPRFAGFSPGATVLDLSSHVDIVPTLLDLAGAGPPPATVRGQSLVPLMLGSSGGAAAPPPRSFIAAEYHSNLGSTGAFAIRTARWKLIWFATATFPWFEAYEPQLFDLDSDPYELANVAAANPALVTSLLAQLEAEFGGTGSLARIDASQMLRNFQRFNDYFADKLSPAALETAFEAAFRNVSAAVVAADVARWRAAAANL
jgi:arylsulfatase K